MKNKLQDSCASLHDIRKKVISCKKCPRLATYIRVVAREKRRAYVNENYWGKPVPSFGDENARVLLIGLAPAAHGANRTGRMFTGDRSGEWLYGALYKFGFCNQPDSKRSDDGLILRDCYITAAVRCAPPDNKPLPDEFENCRPYLVEELHALKNVKVFVALGQIAMKEFLKAWKETGNAAPKPAPKFSHGVEVKLNDKQILICSYHPSQQNTFTGKLTRDMFHAVFRKISDGFLISN